ncbi:hypothetical protein BDV33DRAFT_201413 [Aspergillus novoparasiticus]|uniref:Protein kinase domain-containing protein n=1 Tax=Aspergillus novoparasiticus TaxID=986946 RepID=A0A5N6EZH8_9EURO|nr:hypothetical protein BDV33DRAFT_201413 [Aspergillus novoparasiticus]
MAELAIGVPGLIDVIIRTGSQIMNIVQAYSEQDEIRAEYMRFGEDIAMGGMSFYFLETVKRALKDPSLPGVVRQMFESCIRRFYDRLAITLVKLRALKPSRFSGRVSYAVHGKNELRKCMHSLKDEIDILHKLCIESSLFSMGVHSSILSRENFALIHESEYHHPGEYLPTSDILVARGELNLGLGKTTQTFIVEGKTDGEANLRSLCETLRSRSFPAGIPECVGFRMPPYREGMTCYELIFKTPTGGSLTSLAHLISSSEPPEFKTRLDLARQLVQAVVHVHEIGFVHKKIRPRSILLLEGNDSLTVFLLNWTAARNRESVSAHLGEHLWQQAIYQHPDRQSEYAMTGFEPRHDVYSLGVCLLEIFLWKSFTTAEPPPKLTLYGSVGPGDRLDQKLTSPAWILDLFEKKLVEIGEEPSLPRTDTCKLMTLHKLSQQIWVSLAATELAKEFQRAADIVLQCLQLHSDRASDVLSQLVTA